eukprot:7692645-Heterocapsa_arctica.AAC.1
MLLDNLDGVRTVIFPQCELGAHTTKRTALKGNSGLAGLPTECSRERVWWRIPWSGRWVFGSHPPLRGKQWAVPADAWRTSMLRRGEPSGPYLTRGASAYPGPMNRLLARALVKAAGLAERKKLQTRSLVMQPKAAGAMPGPRAAPGRSDKVIFSENLRGTLPNAKELRQQEDRGALAGMRNAATAVD